MSVASDARGFKRICTGCGTRFYDLNKRPVICPSCSEEFTGEQKVKGRRGRAVAEDPIVAEKAVIANDDTSDEDDDITIAEVSLDDVQADEDDTDAVDGEDDIDLGEDTLDDDLADDDVGVLSDDDDDDDIALDVSIKLDDD